MAAVKQNEDEMEALRHVFAYGSLIWRPGFEYVKATPARIYGLHRAFCVSSVHWRGTRTQPGLVLGLDNGGACAGVLYQVRAKDWRQVRHYLRAREQVTMVYREIIVQARTPSGKVVKALTFAVDRAHRQYAGRKPLEEQARIMAKAKGVGGPNSEYLAETAQALEGHGIHDRALSALLAHVEKS